MKNSICTSLLLLFASILPSFGQITLSGKIADSQTRTPLPGATYVISTPDSIPGAMQATDAGGNFSVTAVDENAVLQTGHLGYESQSILVKEFINGSTIYLQPGNIQLTEVVVTGYETERKLLETAGAISLLTPKDMQRFSNTSLVPVMNTLPGVRMEERSPGSYRFSIRGSLIRSPFGVRNVKFYWNEIPLTDAGGNTPLNAIDFNTVGRVEVIKGPAGSLYGAGTGGVVILQSPRASGNESSVGVTGLVGSYGLRGINTMVQSGSEKNNVVVTYGHQESDGYRENSVMRRDMVNLRTQFFVDNKRTLAINSFYSDLFYETPGGITQAQMEKNDRLSRQPTATLPGSIQQRASIRQKLFNLGVAQTYQWNEHWSNTTSLYGTFTEFANPFITNYEERTEQGLGGRTRTTYTFTWGPVRNRLTAGGEMQRSFTDMQNYGNRGGEPDTLQTDDEITSFQYFAFGQWEAELPANIILTAGGSYNRLQYRFRRLSDVPSFRQNRQFSPVLSPRIALLKTFYQQMAVHGSVSYGFSPPTIQEIRPSEGTFNTNLQAEKGVNYEAGFRGSAWKNRITFDINTFFMQLSQTIVRRSTESGAEYFVNAGRTDQKGVEAAASVMLIGPGPSGAGSTGFFSQVRISGSYTHHSFKYKAYQQGEVNYTGKRVAGIAPNVAVVGIDAATKPGLYTNITFSFTDFIPLNDANTAFANDYALLGGRLGFRRSFGKHLDLDLYAGVDNALDEKYSLGNDLNALGNRYFNPAARINYYSGLSVKYRLSARKKI